MPEDIEIDFLFLKLQSVIKDSLVSKNSSLPTKNSLSPVKAEYDEKIFNPYENKNRAEYSKNQAKLALVSSETLVKLFRDYEMLVDEYTVNKLAALILFLDNKINHAECIKQILNKEVWASFIKIYEPEFSSFVLKQTFILYYWKFNHVHIAQLILRLNEDKTDWVDCNAVYYDYDQKNKEFTECKLPYKVALIPRTEHTSKNTLSLYIYYDYQITQITISIPSSDIYHQQIFVCNYTTHSRLGHLYGGNGVLKKYKNSYDKIAEINTKKTIDDQVYNILYEKASDTSYNFNNLDELPNAEEVEKLKDLQGVWVTYNLRSHKPEDTIEQESESGGIEKSYLKIEPSGKIYFRTDESEEDGYPGFMNYPENNRKFIAAKVYLNPKRNYKIQMFLNLNDQKNILEGVMSGWSSEEHPFASLVRMEKLSSKHIENFTALEPKFFPKRDIVHSTELSDSLKSFLLNGRKFLDTSNNCLPHYAEGKRDFLKKLTGCYYLLSRDYQEGMFDKAKLQIFETGEFLLHYPDVSYKGDIKEFISTNVSDKHIYLNILFKKSNNNKWSKFSGGLLFNLPDSLFDDKTETLQKDAKKAIVGLSLRKNVQSFIQSKKEILIPADNQLEFEQEKPGKYKYSDEDKLLKNLKKQDGQDNINMNNLHSIITNMRGKENNIMLISRRDAITMPIRETDYFDLYMNSFLFEVIFSTQPDKPKIYNYLFQSLLHLDDGDKLKEKIEEIVAKKALKINLGKEFFEKINSLYNSIIKMADDGSLSDFLEAIKTPKYLQNNNSPLLNIVEKMLFEIRNSI